MSDLVRCPKPDVAIEKSGRTAVVNGSRWQGYCAVDDEDARYWEHNETRDLWFEHQPEGA